MFRVLAPNGSFVLNIKEKAVDGERHTYVLDLILALKREVGFRWVEEYIGTRRPPPQANGNIAFGTHGSDYYISPKLRMSR